MVQKFVVESVVVSEPAVPTSMKTAFAEFDEFWPWHEAQPSFVVPVIVVVFRRISSSTVWNDARVDESGAHEELIAPGVDFAKSTMQFW